MSLLNMLLGKNPFHVELVNLLGVGDPNSFGRFRDAYTNEEADKIFILTRNYGEEWEDTDKGVAEHPLFIQKVDDSEDGTYTVYEFHAPFTDEARDFLKMVAEQTDTTPTMDRFRQLCKDMQEGKDTELVRHAMEVGKKIIAPIQDVMDGKVNNLIFGIENEFGGVELRMVTPEEAATKYKDFKPIFIGPVNEEESDEETEEEEKEE